MVAVAPSADARTTASSVQPNMNAGSGPKLSSRYAKMPPERGKAPASSAIVRAPNRAMTPPRIQQRMTGPGSCSWAATVAGTRKIPLPMVTPTRTATALRRPIWRGRRSPQRSGCPTTPSPAPTATVPPCLGASCWVKSLSFRCKRAHARRLIRGRRRLGFYAIATISLGSIQRKVGAFQHCARGIGARPENRAPDARGDPPIVRTPARRINRHDGLAKPLGRVPRLIHVHMGQNDEEFLATQPAEEAGLDDAVAYGAGHSFQHFIARWMPELVIDLLEVININDEYGARPLLRIMQQRIETRQHRTPVRHIRQLIGQRQIFHAKGVASLVYSECGED